MGRHIRLIWPVAGVAAAAAVAIVVTLSGTLAAWADRERPGLAGSGSHLAGLLRWSPSDTPAPGPSRSPSPAGGTTKAPARFTTLKPGADLPSGAQCAAWVRAKPTPENKRSNRAANKRTGRGIGTAFFDDPRSNRLIAPRVDGNFTGSTRDILRWTACKWGVDQNLVFAQAAIESGWDQTAMGGWGSQASRCAPGHELGADGRAGKCPENFGILQARHPYQQAAWPGVWESTAMNADLAYAIWRSCYEGYDEWLNTVEHGRTYAAGDLWGCVGRWNSGRWYAEGSDRYVAKVRDYRDRRVWELRDFQQP